MKCQNCKAVLPNNTRICEYCDTKVEEPKSQHGEFLKDLEKKLMEVDESIVKPADNNERKNFLDMANASMKELKALDKAKKQKILIIQNSTVPNNKNDLFDLLLHASTIAKSLGTGIDQIANKGMMNVWHAKAAQAYHKLLLIAEEDEKLEKILKPFEASYGMQNIATPMSSSKSPMGNRTISVEISDKNKWVAFALAFCLGMFGAHRFYVGKTGSALAQLFTLGGLYIWWMVDIFAIFNGNFTDSNGRPLK